MSTEPTLRRVPLGSERDAYLPLFHLADDSADQMLGYYQTGTLFALDEPDGTPVGLVLAIDEPDGSVELKAVAVDEARRRAGRRNSPPAVRLTGWNGLFTPGYPTSAPAAPRHRLDGRYAQLSEVESAARPASPCLRTPSLFLAPTHWWPVYTREATAGAVRTGSSIAAFPNEPERTVYNNALFDAVSRRPNVQRPSTRWKRRTFRAASRGSPLGSTRATPRRVRTGASRLHRRGVDPSDGAAAR